MSALSQAYPGSSSLRNRGFLAQCWIPSDKLVQKYPTISRLYTKKDIVAVVGYSNEVRNLRNRCRELHVTDMRLKEIFGTVIIDEGITYGPKDIIVHSEKENETVLGIADVVIISASTLVNNTFDDIMTFSKRAHLIIYTDLAVHSSRMFFLTGVLILSLHSVLRIPSGFLKT